MYEVHPVIYGTISSYSKFSINHQAKYQNPGIPMYLNSRLDCVLEVCEFVNGTEKVSKHIEFICTNPAHVKKHRLCCQRKGVLKVTPMDLVDTKVPRLGNMLVRIFTGRCHSCGEGHVPCWAVSGHIVCKSCIARPVATPYAYGLTSNNECCYKKKCGKGLLLFSRSDIDVYKDAVTLMSRKG